MNENEQKVYVAKVIEMNDGIPTVHVEVFSTREKAEAFFNAKVALYKELNDMENYGVIEDETNNLFFWTAEIGFYDDALEITIDECEVK